MLPQDPARAPCGGGCLPGDVSGPGLESRVDPATGGPGRSAPGCRRRVAVRLKAERTSRRSHEARAAEIRTSFVDDRGEAWPELHEEIDRLPDRYREPVVLCYMEGLSTEAAALRLGCPRGTVLSRLSRAREQLRTRLVRRGLAPAILAAAAESSGAARRRRPQTLITSTVQASLAFTRQPTPAAGVVSTTATALATGMMHTLMMTKLKALRSCLSAPDARGYPDVRASARRPGGPGGANPGAQDRKATLARFAGKLQSELDESLRINVEMRKELQAIRATLDELGADVPPMPPSPACQLPEAGNPESATSDRPTRRGPEAAPRAA